MEKQKAYNKIKEIASQLSKENKTYTRADLAYELKAYGIQCDSLDVTRLVQEAFDYFENDNNIDKVFVNNEKTQTLIKECGVERLFEANNIDGVFSLLDEKGANILTLLEKTDERITNALQSITGSSANLVQHMSGQAGIVKVNERATKMYDNYKGFVDAYILSEQEIKNVISDFKGLRSEIVKLYHEYANVLIDTFGQSIIKVEPSLFDFDSIQFLDTKSMKNSIELEFENLTKSCQGIMSQISESFSQNIHKSAKVLNSKANGKLKLALAGLNMINHYLDAGQKTTELNQELVVFKGNMDHDIACIRGDLGRLQVIHKTINDLHIPRAKAFFRHSKEVFSKELKDLFQTIYKNPKSKEIKQQRDSLLLELNRLVKTIIDNQLNIDSYKRSIKESQKQLKDNNPFYIQALQRKPKKPFFLFNLITFGALKKTYNRSIYEWRDECLPVINIYENLNVEIKLDSDELSAHKSELVHNKEQYQVLKKQINKLSNELRESIKNNAQEKLKFSKSLNSIFSLIHQAKVIACSGVEEKLFNVVSIESYKQNELPQLVKNNIEKFVDELTQDVKGEFTEIASLQIKTLSESDKQITKKQIDELTFMSNEAIQNTINLAEALAHLKKMQINNQLAKASYDEEVEKLHASFKESISEIDDEAEVLRATLKKINSSTDREELRNGLLELTKLSSKEITNEELDKFIEGRITIEI